MYPVEKASQQLRDPGGPNSSGFLKNLGDRTLGPTPGAPNSPKYRPYLYTLGPKVGIIYIHGAPG